ncbi:MAG: peptidylprolyl isomerase [Bacteriovoracaceae bacterium]|nr:peptidylprolyl isomerase [Bacteriovoracaceae bacterium]
MKKITVVIASILMFTGSVLATPVATVNGDLIEENVFDQTYKQTKLFLTHKKVTKETVLNDMISRQLGIQKALRLKLQLDPTVKQKMQDVLYHAMISKDLGPEFKKIKVVEKDVKKYYSEYPEYRTAHILFRTRSIPSQPESEEALKAAWKVYNTLKSDKSKFPELASKFSQASVAQLGGDMGFQPAVKLAKSYFMAIKGKKQGHITKPVASPFGFHVIKVLAEKDFKDINYPLYQKIVYDKKRDAIISDYFKRLKKGASIHINKKLLK